LCIAELSRPVMIIEVWENVVPGFNFRERGFLDLAREKLIVKFREAKKVVRDTAPGVIGAGAGAKYERPIAGLSEKQFAGGLLEGAKREAVRGGKPAGEFRHPVLSDLEVRINPFGFLV